MFNVALSIISQGWGGDGGVLPLYDEGGPDDQQHIFLKYIGLYHPELIEE